MTERPFEALGLSADADRAYPLLIATRGVATAELARILGVPGERAEAACGELAARGLAELGTDDLWYPLPPRAGLLPMMSRAEEQLRRGRELLDHLGVVYQRVHEGHRAEEIVRTVQGAEAIARHAADVRGAAREELLFFARGPGAAGDLPPAGDPHVRRRVLLERAEVEAEFAFGGVQAPGGTQVRVVERLPVRLCIADRRTAMLPLAADGAPPDPVLLVIGPSGLLDALVSLFESLWARGVPLGPPQDDVRLRILSMLVGGSTDAAMARALGVAVRTVQRHIAAMERSVGADNRVQLVWHAARHGWLDG